MTRLPALAAAALLTAAAGRSQPPAPAAPAGDDTAAELVRAGKTADALAELQKAARADPRRPPARVRLAELLAQAGQPAAARTQVEQAAADDPRHPAVLLINASLAFADGRLVDTVLSCREAAAAAADPRWDADQRKAFQREARLGLAAALRARRDWAGARDQLAQVLAAEPDFPAARQQLAEALFWLGDPDKALAELRAVRAADPTADLPELRMSRLWAAKAAPDRAEAWLKKAVAAHPADPGPPQAYAAFLLDAGRPDDARPQVAAAARLAPAARETKSLQGLLARYRRDFAAARAVFDDLHRDRPADRFAAWNLALVLAESADPADRRRAVELAEAEAQRAANDPEGFAVLGWCYYKAGRPGDAERALGRAAAGGRVRLDTGYFLARLLADKGQPDDARKLLREVLGGRGPFPYRDDAKALLADLDKAAPPAPAKK